MKRRVARKIMRAIQNGKVTESYFGRLLGPYSKEQVSSALKICDAWDFVKAFSVPHFRSLWGVQYTVEPACVEAKHGDGGQVLFLTATNHRPDYYVLRVDSSLRGKRTENQHWFIENVAYELIDNEFYEPCYCEEDGLEECECPGFPNPSFESGSSWSFWL